MVVDPPPTKRDTLKVEGGSPVAMERARAIEEGREVGETGIIGLWEERGTVKFTGLKPKTRESREHAEVLRAELMI